MTDEKTGQEAYKQATDEMNEGKVLVIKQYVKDTLQAIENSKELVEKENEKQRIWKLDLDDLRHGRIDKIIERQKESPEAHACSKVITITMPSITLTDPFAWFWNGTGGTYTVNTSTGIRNFYLNI